MSETSTFVRRREPRPEGYSAFKVSRGVPVVVHPQDAPDPIRQGDFRGRQPKERLLHWLMFEAWQTDSFLLKKHQPPPLARIPRGHQMPHGNRFNIRRPPTVSFGSQFEFAAEG